MFRPWTEWWMEAADTNLRQVVLFFMSCFHLVLGPVALTIMVTITVIIEDNSKELFP